MKNTPRQPPQPPEVLLEGQQAERQMQKLLHQLVLDDPKLCLRVIRHWLEEPPSSKKRHG